MPHAALLNLPVQAYISRSWTYCQGLTTPSALLCPSRPMRRCRNGCCVAAAKSIKLN